VWHTEAPRILVSRMSAVGDTILTLPVLCALRNRFPQAFLGWVVEQKASSVVLEHSCVDEVIVLERGWFTSPSSILAARRRLRRGCFEIAIDCQNMTKSALAGWLSGARTRIGCRGKYGRELSPWLNSLLVQTRRPHLTDRSLELLAPLGIERPEVQWKFPIAAADHDNAGQVLRLAGIDGDFATINPGASWLSRRWEMDRFAAVASYLGRQHKLPTLVIWGNDRERNWAREIVNQSEGQAILAPPTSLAELAAVLNRARIFVGADAGPLHLAVAVGTPCISLHGITRPEDSGPHGKPHLALQVQHEVHSRRQRKRVDNYLMRLITPEMTCQKCSELLERTADRAEIRDQGPGIREQGSGPVRGGIHHNTPYF